MLVGSKRKPKAKGGSLAAQLSGETKKELKEHWKDDVDYGAGADPPPGICGGVAKLVDCKFDTYKRGTNEGEYYFRAAGVILEPKSVGNVQCEGRQTSIMEPVCETERGMRKSQSEHVLWIFNELKKLGADVEGSDPSELEDIAEAVKEAAPYFNFRTHAGGDKGQYLNQNWEGFIEDYEPEEGEENDGVVEEKEAEEEEEEEGADTPESEGEVEGNEEEAPEIDIPGLIELAGNGDEEAEKTISDYAIKVGVDQSAVEEATDWESVGQMITEALEGKGEEEGDDSGEEEEVTVQPDKGELFFYKPPKARKRVECEVTAVFVKKETCNLKNLSTNKFFKSVPWDKLFAEAT